jgi:hypothetical protein
VGEVEVFHEGFELRAGGVMRFRMGQSLRRHVVTTKNIFGVRLYLVLCCVVLCCVVLCGYVLYGE